MNEYMTGVKELDNAIEGIRKGSNIMLIGPPMSGKEAILYQMMYHGAARNENGIIMVTTRESAPHILERFKENKSTDILSRIGIVDCITKRSKVMPLITQTLNLPVAR